KYMVEDSRPVALLTQSRLQTLAEEIRQTTPVVDLSRSELWQGQPENNPGRGAVGMTPQHIAYVLYTSGSTGLPKGVAVQHSALVNFLRSMKEKPGIEAEDALLSVTTISFDIAALELYLPLIAGAQVRIASKEVGMDGARLLEELSNGVSIMQATPATWQMLLEAGWEGTEGLKVLCGGEAI